MSDRVGVLFVCLGNICRSPTAHGVFAAKVEAANLADRVHVDSAGTAAYHIGNPPDPRATEAAAGRGIDLSPLRARQAVAEDFERFDYVIAMDDENYANLARLGGGAPDGLFRFLEFATNTDETEVPDPYYGGDAGFERVLDMIDNAADGLLDAVRGRLT